MISTPKFRYDVALSFAGEDRPLVDKLANCLRKYGIKVFYDAFEATELWGANLQSHFTKVYSEWSQFAVIIISEHYKRKNWWSRASDRAIHCYNRGESIWGIATVPIGVQSLM